MASGIVEPSSQEPQGAGDSAQTPGAISRNSKLVERLLNASATLPAFIHDLLTTQAVVVAATEAAAFILEKSEKPDGPPGLRPVSHIRPENADPQTRNQAMNAFKNIVGACVVQGKDGAIEINTNDTDTAALPGAEPLFCLITILRQEGNPVAVSAVITRCLNSERARQRLVAMQIVAGYFELYTLKRNVEQSQLVAQSHQHVLQLATAVATSSGFDSAAMSLCNELASRTKSVRVTLGWIKGHDVKVVAFSHTEQFDKKQELVVELQKVMEECVDQDEPVHFVPGEGGSANVTRAAAAFSRAQGGNAVLSLPLRRQSEVVGVVVLEFVPNAQLPAQAMNSLTVSVDLLGPQLFDRYQNDRWLITKIGLWFKEFGEKAVGPQHMLPKLISIAVAVILFVICNPLGLGFMNIEYHVSAPFEFAALAKTTIPSPVDGYIEEVNVRPGDRVHKGDVLMKFKTDDLKKKFEQAKFDAERTGLDAAKAMADSRDDPTKIADYWVHAAEQKSSLSQADLYQHQIAESTITAPSDGIILTGDLEDQINSFKKQGDELFTFQAGTQLRAELSVAENDIQEVWDFGLKNGGELATTSLPRERYPFTIDHIDAMAQPKEGANIFKVYANLPESPDHPEWRPGMEGEARINIEKRRIVWVWTHKFFDWLRLKSWTLW